MPTLYFDLVEEAKQIIESRTKQFDNPLKPTDRYPKHLKGRIELLYSKFSKAASEMFENQKNAIIAWLRKGFKQFEQGAKQISIDPKDIDDILAVHSYRFQSAVHDLMSEGVQLGGTEGSRLLGATFNVRDPMAEAWITTKGASLVTKIDDYTKGILVNLLHDGARRGLSLPEIEKNITGVFNNWSAPKMGLQSRAMRIARTETAYAYNGGSLISYQQSGLVSYVDVHDNEVPRSCKLCKDVNGARWTLEEAMNKPLAHPNCVRAFSPVVGDEVAKRIGRDPEIESLDSEFGQWHSDYRVLRNRLSEKLGREYREFSNSLSKWVESENYNSITPQGILERFINAGMDVGRAKNALSMMERASLWNLKHRFPGKNYIRLYHGAKKETIESTERLITRWQTREIRPSFNATTNPDIAASFAGNEGAVITYNVPFSEIRGYWALFDSFDSFMTEREFILKAGRFIKPHAVETTDRFVNKVIVVSKKNNIPISNLWNRPVVGNNASSMSRVSSTAWEKSAHIEELLY